MGLVNALNLLKIATAAGELDAQMDAALAKVERDLRGGEIMKMSIETFIIQSANIMLFTFVRPIKN